MVVSQFRGNSWQDRCIKMVGSILLLIMHVLKMTQSELFFLADLENRLDSPTLGMSSNQSSNVVNTEGGQHTELPSLQYTVCFDPLTQYDALKTL